MNTLELKSIAELRNMAFYIPAYQRGYRWTQRQVKDLLKDIFEFSEKKEDAGILLPAAIGCGEKNYQRIPYRRILNHRENS